MGDFFEYHASDAVTLNISDFEGPIELLYKLIIEDGKYDIRVFPLANITNQYMQYMKQVNVLDMDIASDFVSVAATLLEIKSRNVLPAINDDDNQDFEQDEDPAELLRMRIMMYAMFREKGEKLKMRETMYKFYRKPVFTMKEAIYVVNNFDYDKLIDTYGQILMNMNEKELQLATKKIQKDKFTVADKIAYLTKRLFDEKRVSFSSLFPRDKNKSEIISTFQALLELMKKQIVVATQETYDGDIVMTINDEIDEKDIDIESLTKVEGEDA